jgi:hypothetical protein
MNNYVEFDGIIYLQIQGTAMGTPVAVTFANLFLLPFEIQLLADIKL